MSKVQTPNQTLDELILKYKEIYQIKYGGEFVEILEAIMDSLSKFEESIEESMNEKDFIAFIDEIRKSLFLTTADEEIIAKILKLSGPDTKKNDPEDTECISKESFLKNFSTIIHLIGKPGKFTEKLIKKVFQDFDFKDVGFLTSGDMRLLFGLLCDSLRVERLQEWELDYQLNLLDDDGNKTIDYEEFVNNYCFIAEHLMRNKPAKYLHSVNLMEEYVKMSSCKDQPFFIQGLLEKYNFMRKKTIDLNAGEEEDEDEDDNNDVFKKNRKSACEIMPITRLIEKTVVKRNQKNLCDRCRMSEKRKSLRSDTWKPDLIQHDRNSMPSLVKPNVFGKGHSMHDIIPNFTSNRQVSYPKFDPFEVLKKPEHQISPEEEQGLLKYIEEKIDEVLVAPYNENMAGQRQSVTEVNKMISKSISCRYISATSMHQITEEDHPVKENMKKSSNDLELYKSETAQKTNMKEMFARAKKKTKVLESLNKGLVFPDTLMPVVKSDCEINNNKDSQIFRSSSIMNFPVINMKSNHIAYNVYPILNQMAFYKDIKDIPEEVDALFHDLKLNKSSKLFDEIKKIQDLLLKNIENMDCFIDDSTAYVIKKLEAEGEMNKAKEMHSKKAYLNNKTQNLIKKSPKTMSCSSKTQNIPQTQNVRPNASNLGSIANNLGSYNLQKASDTKTSTENIFRSQPPTSADPNKPDNARPKNKKNYIIKKPFLSQSSEKDRTVSARPNIETSVNETSPSKEIDPLKHQNKKHLRVVPVNHYEKSNDNIQRQNDASKDNNKTYNYPASCKIIRNSSQLDDASNVSVERKISFDINLVGKQSEMIGTMSLKKSEKLSQCVTRKESDQISKQSPRRLESNHRINQSVGRLNNNNHSPSKSGEFKNGHKLSKAVMVIVNSPIENMEKLKVMHSVDQLKSQKSLNTISWNIGDTKKRKKNVIGA